jgi:hypothetical protein
MRNTLRTAGRIKTRAAERRGFRHCIHMGDILVRSWGYERTKLLVRLSRAPRPGLGSRWGTGRTQGAGALGSSRAY